VQTGQDDAPGNTKTSQHEVIQSDGDQVEETRFHQSQRNKSQQSADAVQAQGAGMPPKINQQSAEDNEVRYINQSDTVVGDERMYEDLELEYQKISSR